MDNPATIHSKSHFARALVAPSLDRDGNIAPVVQRYDEITAAGIREVVHRPGNISPGAACDRTSSAGPCRFATVSAGADPLDGAFPQVVFK